MSQQIKCFNLMLVSLELDDVIIFNLKTSFLCFLSYESFYKSLKLSDFSPLAMQVISYPFGEDGFYFAPLSLRLNVYTAPGFLGLIMAIVNMVVVCVWFKETEVDIYNGQNNVNIGTSELIEIHTLSVRPLYSTFRIIAGIKNEEETVRGQDTNLPEINLEKGKPACKLCKS